MAKRKQKGSICNLVMKGKKKKKFLRELGVFLQNERQSQTEGTCPTSTMNADQPRYQSNQPNLGFARTVGKDAIKLGSV